MAHHAEGIKSSSLLLATSGVDAPISSGWRLFVLVFCSRLRHKHVVDCIGIKMKTEEGIASRLKKVGRPRKSTLSLSIDYEPEEKSDKKIRRFHKNVLTKETILKFIAVMERTPCLWNPNDPAYKKKQERKSEAWREVSKKVGVSAAKLRSKWAALKSTYRAHRTKFDKQIPFAWYAYDAMSFLEGLLDKKPSPAFVAVDPKLQDHASELNDETKSEEVDGEEDDYDSKYIIEEIVDQATVQPEPQDKGMHIESTATSNSTSSTSSSSSSSSSSTTTTPLIVQAVQGQVDRSCWPQPDRCKLFSQCVSMRMVNFSLQQQSFAEKMINDILFEGEQGRLTAEHVYSVELEMQRLRSAMWFQSA
ncbi:uncharacterized protein LOC120903914 isoform X1 [Anopheles arabiensis]|uniref:uncharacterized protein LOC120903914 isoform X1 n=1 Tax=Anopheles arabiensis TaxID=7173 RepID=UPI001AACCD54|nr:uncharacterized protein LOC120903914 isoform X1 [Anopheles arabiensis]